MSATPPPTLAFISVTPTTVSIEEGQSQQFTATGTFSDSSTADLTSTPTWVSDITLLGNSDNTTDGSGVSMLLSPNHRADSGDIFRFIVTDVTLTEATYDPGPSPPNGEDTVP